MDGSRKDVGTPHVLDVEALTETGAGAAGVMLTVWGSDVSSSRPYGEIDVTIKGITFTPTRRAWWTTGKGTPILRSITGSFQPRCLSVIMGPSGCGKTTLLDILAGRKSSGRVKGDVLFAGRRATEAFLRRHTAYVERDDTLMPYLSVEEMLACTAELKMPTKEGASAKRAVVEELLDKLALNGCRGLQIGDPLRRGISQGEARRTSIAIQLIGRPSVLFLDNPTSGLDALTANKVLTLVKAVAADGVTVISSMESPTEAVFNTVDSLLVLLRGCVVYWGPGGAPALDYAAELPLAAAQGKLAPQEPTPRQAEWLAALYAGADERQVAALADYYTHSTACKAAVSQATGAGASKSSTSQSEVAASTQCPCGTWDATATPWCWQLATLFRYRALTHFRSPAWLLSRVPQGLLLALGLVAIYFDLGAKVTILNSFYMVSLLFMWIIIPYLGSVALIPGIMQERRLFVRERQDGLYRTSAYLAEKFMEDVLALTPSSVAAACLVFFLCQVHGSLGVFWLANWSAMCCGAAMAYGIAAWSPTPDFATMLMPLYIGILLFFAGFIQLFRSIPRGLIWLSWLNPVRYAWTAVMINQFGGTNARFVDGKPVLVHFEVSEETIPRNIGLVWAFFAAHMVAAWGGMRVTRHYYRR